MLTTSHFVPPVRAGYLPRLRLYQLLDQGTAGPLTLLSAAAGYGKSSLVSAWAQQRGVTLAWLSLAPEHSHPEHFLQQLIAAVQVLKPELGAAALTMLQASQRPPLDQVFIQLVAELEPLTEPLLLVLDDYHRVDNGEVDRLLGRFVEHMPATVRLLLLTREDPNLALARMRAEGKLLEIRAAQLRFTAAEVEQWVGQDSALVLSAGQSANLTTKTEGWAAGLQLAALSLAQQSDYDGAIQRLTGNSRHIFDYLLEQVLLGLEPALRRFLATATRLQRFCADLCNHVMAIDNSVALLRKLDAHNLFVIPLDDERCWYRFHHLFADALQSFTEPALEPALLFGRASNWYWQQGLWQDAIDHAFAAGDHKLAMQQLEVVWPGQRATASEQLLLDWCNRFSANQLAQSPLLCAYYGLALLASDFARGQLLLNEAQATATPAMGVEHGIVAIGQAYIAAAMGESQRALQQVQWARQQLPAAEQVWRGAAAALCGITHWQQGQLNAAVPEMQRAIAHMDQSNDISASISTRYLLGDIYLQQGNLLALERVLQAGLDRLEGGTGTAPQGAADLYVLQAELLYERDEPALALAALEAASAQGEQAKLAESQHRWHLLMARLQLAAGEWDLAAEQLALAQALQQPSPVPDWQPLAAWQLRLNLRRQRLPVAAEVVAGNTLEVETDATTGVAITAANLFEQITLCQQQLLGLGLESGSGASEAEAGVLQQRLMALGSYARQLGLYPRQLEAELLLVALGLLTRDSAAAGRLLADAVAIMRGRRLLRPLLDLILPAAIYSEFHHLLPADLRRRWSLPELTSDAHSQAPPPVLLEPLSEREQEVLHWYASDLSGPQIAEQLYISMNTLRTHSKNIYTKLGVNNRRAAVSLGRQHGLI